ncbi:MAG: vitamin K epoxide reductase family protein [Anaplasmataceae bacterium]|nr:vitamin K epoxide reductase family protein [Anaplasmataceae bacterium]
MSFYFLPIIVAAIGFEIAYHISKTKKRGRPLVCPVGADCDSVVHSDYSKFLGYPVEGLGMLYYGFITAVYLVLTIAPSLGFQEVFYFVGVVSLGAFIFSLYLIFVQAFIIRAWCTWCLASAALSTILAYLAYLSIL